MLGSPAGAPPSLEDGLCRLCVALVDELQLDGAFMTLMTAPGSESVVAMSDAGADRLQVLQFTAGEGPNRDAFESGHPVLEPDLARSSGRWPGFARAAGEAGVCAVFAFPLRLGAMRFGVLSCFSAKPRALDAHEVAQCLIFADVATEMLLATTATTTGDRAGHELGQALHIRTEVYQAQGMVMIELGVSLAEAMVRLRAHAYAEGLDLNELAADVVAGKRRLPSTGQGN